MTPLKYPVGSLLHIVLTNGVVNAMSRGSLMAYNYAEVFTLVSKDIDVCIKPRHYQTNTYHHYRHPITKCCHCSGYVITSTYGSRDFRDHWY